MLWTKGDSMKRGDYFAINFKNLCNQCGNYARIWDNTRKLEGTIVQLDTAAWEDHCCDGCACLVFDAIVATHDVLRNLAWCHCMFDRSPKILQAVKSESVSCPIPVNTVILDTGKTCGEDCVVIHKNERVTLSASFLQTLDDKTLGENMLDADCTMVTGHYFVVAKNNDVDYAHFSGCVGRVLQRTPKFHCNLFPFEITDKFMRLVISFERARKTMDGFIETAFDCLEKHAIEKVKDSFVLTATRQSFPVERVRFFEKTFAPGDRVRLIEPFVFDDELVVDKVYADDTLIVVAQKRHYLVWKKLLCKLETSNDATGTVIAVAQNNGHCLFSKKLLCKLETGNGAIDTANDTNMTADTVDETANVANETYHTVDESVKTNTADETGKSDTLDAANETDTLDAANETDTLDAANETDSANAANETLDAANKTANTDKTANTANETADETDETDKTAEETDKRRIWEVKDNRFFLNGCESNKSQMLTDVDFFVYNGKPVLIVDVLKEHIVLSVDGKCLPIKI